MFAIFRLPSSMASRRVVFSFQAFVQTHRRADLRLQLCQLAQHRPGKRLLEHHQIEVIELP